MASHFFGHLFCLDAPGMLGCVAAEMSHTPQGNAEKFMVLLRNSPKMIVPPAESHQEVHGSRLEAPYGTSQRHVMALAWPVEC